MATKIRHRSEAPKGASSRLVGLMIIAVLTLVGCGGSSTTATTEPPPTPWSLHSTTEAGLTAYFREALGPTSTRYLGSIWAMDLPAATTAAPAASGATTAVFSNTTLQEAGVDEADLIKSDGTYVFNLEPATATDFTRDVLRRQRLGANAGDASLVPVDSLKIAFSAGVRGTGLYLNSERQQLAVIAEGVTAWGIFDAWFAPQLWGQSVTEVALIDTANPVQLQKIRTLRMTAQLIGSRRLGSMLYLVMRSYPQVPGLDPSWPAAKAAANQAVLDALQSAQLLPTLSIDGGAAQPLVQASSCFTQENNAVKSADIITVVGIDLASATHRHAARCFTGGTEAFYMSDQSLYLATTRTAYTYSGALPVYAGQTSTDIHKFALKGLDIAYRGSGNVTGHLGFDQNRKSFRMGEDKGVLRVITQTAPPADASGATIPMQSPAHLTILQESASALAVVSELPNASRPAPLGKEGEQLYASRFIGTRSYLVTYRLTDPLYVLDLSNPADPKMAGELQVSGYSDYLFPLSDTLLLGVGKDAISDGMAGDGRFAWYQGVKLSLIDVTNPAQPREAARSIIGRRGTNATALHSHHGVALQTVGNTVRVSLPISLHDIPPLPATGAANDYFQFTRTELQKFEIDLSGQSLTPRTPLASTVMGERDIRDDRSLLWNNQVHYYQNGIWRSAGW
ncbi:beta-propeller domain-containing protein [Rhodoferax ferrireducens]|uniref:beta-propeller domain-containing protein n=1 Tax=Rhodoferax ferrireducens TaxID=192843 RepID=UPI00130044E9|nr:beta-propeller domain-containing protein [Rhodoferax ferrireducens]